jgi:hypothetical protein
MCRRRRRPKLEDANMRAHIRLSRSQGGQCRTCGGGASVASAAALHRWKRRGVPSDALRAGVALQAAVATHTPLRARSGRDSGTGCGRAVAIFCHLVPAAALFCPCCPLARVRHPPPYTQQTQPPLHSVVAPAQPRHFEPKGGGLERCGGCVRWLWTPQPARTNA